MVRACGEGLCVSFSKVFLVRGLSQIHDRHHVPCHRSVLLEIPLKRTMSPCSIHSSMQSGISVAVLARTFCFRCSAFFCDVVLCFIWRHGRAVLRGYGNYWVSIFLRNSKTNTDYCQLLLNGLFLRKPVLVLSQMRGRPVIRKSQVGSPSFFRGD